MGCTESREKEGELVALSQCQAVLTATFRPGRSIGIDIDLSTGQVQGVERGGQADLQGIVSGSYCKSVNGKPFTIDAISQQMRGGKDYTLTLSTPGSPMLQLASANSGKAPAAASAATSVAPTAQKSFASCDQCLPGPVVAPPARVRSSLSASESPTALKQRLEKLSQCDLQVSWESRFDEAEDLKNGLEHLKAIAGQYVEVEKFNGRKRYKNQDSDMFLYWHQGSWMSGRKGWWFGNNIGYAGIVGNDADTATVPVSGWKAPVSMLKAPRVLKIQVKPPARPLPSAAGQAATSCFGCAAGIIAVLSSSDSQKKVKDTVSAASKTIEKHYPVIKAKTQEVSQQVWTTAAPVLGAELTPSMQAGCLQIGTKVCVTTDARLYEQECTASSLSWPDAPDGLPRACRLGMGGGIEAIDESDMTAKLDCHGTWVPLKTLSVLEAGGLRLGMEVQVTTNASLYQRQCSASDLSWPNCHHDISRTSRLGRVGYIEAIDLSDMTTKLGNNVGWAAPGWVPIMALVGFEGRTGQSLALSYGATAKLNLGYRPHEDGKFHHKVAEAAKLAGQAQQEHIAALSAAKTVAAATEAARLANQEQLAEAVKKERLEQAYLPLKAERQHEAAVERAKLARTGFELAKVARIKQLPAAETVAEATEAARLANQEQLAEAVEKQRLAQEAAAGTVAEAARRVEERDAAEAAEAALREAAEAQALLAEMEAVAGSAGSRQGADKDPAAIPKENQGAPQAVKVGSSRRNPNR